ncbi:TolB family protein [Dactylosporangium sp. CS-033363]|uniref:TolB family protein n=1 Tax=Dactylosporangium sp. CS-033363 TaxID=3239935 RepID=UPI003D8FB8E4
MKRPYAPGLAALTALAVLPVLPATTATAAPPPAGNGRIVFSRDYAINHELWSMNPDGSKPKNLTNTAGIQELSPVPSPDGKRIAFTRYGAGPDTLWVMNADTTGLAVVAGSGDADEPAWSPDGKRLAYTCREPLSPFTGHICVRNVAGGGFQLLTAAPGAEDHSPAWSPDGTRIVFSRFAGGSGGLLALTLATLSLDPLTPAVAGRHDDDPDFSPDGKQLAFSRFENNGLGSSLYRIPATGGAEKLIIAGPPIVNDTYLIEPAWSPDGKLIAYSAADDDGGFGAIWTIAPDGKSPTQLTFGIQTDIEPDWLVA